MNITIVNHINQDKQFSISYTGKEWKLFVDAGIGVSLPAALEYDLVLTQDSHDIEITFHNVTRQSPHYPWILLIQILSGDVPDFVIQPAHLEHAALLLEDFFASLTAEVLRSDHSPLSEDDTVFEISE